MAKPVRVLYVHNSVLIGGGNRVLLGLFEQLDRRRFEPWSLLPGTGPMESELRSRDVPCIVADVLSCATSGNKLSRAGVAASLALKIGSKRFQVIHAQSPISYRLPSVVARFTPARRLCHLHFPPSDVRKELEWAFRVKPHMVIACSQSVADGYAPGLQGLSREASARVLVNFADTERFCPGPRCHRLVEELRLDKASHVVTICGQVSERKGHPDFLRMAQKILRSFPAARFLIAGEDILTKGAFQKKMESYAAELGIAGSVSFLGYRSDVPDIVRASDMILLPSYAEGMPLSLIEASSCAKPVVAYDIPGVDEVVVDGKTGRLVPVGSVEELSAAVESLFESKQILESMGREGRSRVEERFSLTAYSKKLESLYEEALAVPVRA